MHWIPLWIVYITEYWYGFTICRETYEFVVGLVRGDPGEQRLE